MRIALVVPGFSAHAQDWAIPALLNLARALAQTHEIHVFSQRYPATGRYEFEGLIHHALGSGQRFGLASAKIWLQSCLAVIRQHRRTPFELLHAFWADEAGFAAVLAGAKLKRPVVVSLGGGELTHLPDINYGAQRFVMRRLTTRYALRRATFVTAGSRYQLELGRAQHAPASKLRLAPLGVDLNLFRPVALKYERMKVWEQGGMKDGQVNRPKPGMFTPPTIVQAASLSPVKNQVLLLEVLSLVKKEIPDIRLNLAGSGPLHHSLQELAHQLELSQNIVWGQQLAYPELVPLYQASHLYLQTSRHESQGMAVLEAMACGLPVLGTPVGVVREIACLPAQTSKEALAAQVIELFSDEIRYLELRQQARQTVEQGFSLAVVTANFSRIYEELYTQ